MVFSNKYALELSGLNNFKLISSTDKVLIADKLANLSSNLEEYIEEDYYTDRNFKETFGVEKSSFDRVVNTMYQYAILSDKNNQEKSDKFFNFMIDRYGHENIFKNCKDILSNELSALSPEAAFDYVKLMYMVGDIDKNTLNNFFIELMDEKAKVAIESLKYSEDHRGFRIYKKDYIDKLINKNDKLVAALAFIYAETSLTEGPLEKLAVDYFIKISGLSFMFNKKTSIANDIKNDFKIKKWLSKHKKAKNFYDLILLSGNQGIKELASCFVLATEFSPNSFILNKNIKGINDTNLNYFFSILDIYKDEYNTPDKAREVLMYLFYIVSHISEQCQEYSEQYLTLSMFFKKYTEEKIAAEVRFKAIIDNYEKQNKNKQESLNKLQLEYNKLKNKDIIKIQEELGKYKELIKKIKDENNSLKDINLILENRLNELEQETKEEKDIKPNSYVENKLRQLNIIIMGGHQIWQNKIKEIYPYFNYIDSDNVNFDINIIRNADIVLFNTLHCSHTLYYKMKNNTNNGRTDNKNKIVYIGSNNLSYFKDLVTNIVLNKNTD